ncbi:MAG: M48 family metallopeptidase [Actinomycetota bacterium]|nr:M48 family metallopeptidase [Actinomycetota bacterium]
MSIPRALVVVLLVATAAAVLVGWSSRAPAEVREADPGRAATDPSLGDDFTDAQIERHGIYRRSTYLGFLAAFLVEVVALVLLARGPLAGVIDAVEGWRGGLALRAAAIGVLVAAFTTVAALPLAFVRGHLIPKAWGLSTQDPAGWAIDFLKGFAIAGVMAAIATVAFFALVRWQPRAWWVWGWAAFTLLTALLVWVYPVVIAPLFNKFTPLEDDALTTRIRAVAEEAGVEVDEVLVADASRRTTSENAYVAGLGPTKQVVLYDTLLRSGGPDETLFVVAHELGHQEENHVLKGVGLSSLGLLVGFALLKLLAGRKALWDWGGADGIADLRALPLLLLFATVLGVLLLPLQNTVSRSFERRADEIAFELTEDPDVAVRSFRRLALSNLADLRPPDLAVFWLFTHPPLPERIEAAMAANRNKP